MLSRMPGLPGADVSSSCSSAKCRSCPSASLHYLLHTCDALMSCCAVQGYGTLLFETKEAAQEAINKHHGTDLEGRTLTVKLDK